MSKLLAMMMKPKNYMYATIKGSLTENNGVFSGFSVSNYLITQSKLPKNSWKNIEIRTKFTTGNSLSNYEYAIRTDFGTGSMGIGITGSNTIGWFLGTIGGSNTFIRNYSITASINTTYYVKAIIKNNIAELYYSTTDFNTMIKIGQRNIEGIFNDSSNLVYLSSGTNVWGGSIDLNNTSIKLGSTKYQLQAVVGYTKVGSPTITDGVVSGFSASNYLQINDFPKSVNFSGKIRAKLNAENSNWSSLFRFQRISPNDRFSVENNIVSQVRIYHYNETTSSNSTNTIYGLSLGGVWIDYVFSYDRVAKTINIKAINVNDNSIVFDVTYDNCVLDNTDYVQFGYMFNGWNGEIDLNETNIKINNKLWFNGQPAE